MTLNFSLTNLGALADGVARPSYARSGLSAGILHFGVGNFHRAHQAVYLDDLFNRGEGHDWAIIGAGVFEAEKAGRDTLAAQDFLTTVVEQDAGHMQARVTGAMVDFVTPGDGRAIVERLADPAIRIVSMTITEGGYFIDPATGAFDPTHPAMARDGAHADAPKTVFGLILAGLRARRAAGVPAFTVMSCDNIPGNGHVTADALVGLARLSDPGFADWVQRTVAFPNSMVDRITPATTDREREHVRAAFGIADGWPVYCEPFRQWVMEDRFPAGRPALEKAGVQFVDDVAPFELMKIRILNGGHAAIAYPAGLMDIHFVHEAMEEPLVRGFLERLEGEKIVPTVPSVPGVDLEDYRRLIERRFSNPTIGDTVRRLCLDGSNRQPKFIIPTIADRLKAGLPVDGLALELALWCRYCFGTTDFLGAAIAPNDPNWERLTGRARAARDDPAAWLSMRDIYGQVAEAPPFRDAFSASLRALWADGTRPTLAAWLSRQ